MSDAGYAGEVMRKWLSGVLAPTVLASLVAAAPPAHGAVSTPGGVSRLMVRFIGRPPSDLTVTVRLHGSQKRQRLSVRRANQAGIARVALPQPLSTGDAAAAAAAVAQLPGVAWAVPEARVHTTAIAPNDPSYVSGGQWGLSGPYGIKAPAAWDIGTGRADVTVAVIDTGITDHEDLAGQTVAGYDMVSDPVLANDGQAATPSADDRDADPHDPGDSYYDPVLRRTIASSWHGTHVAGIIAAQQGNGIGITGASPGVRIQPVRALGAGGGSSLDVVDSIVWAAGGSVPGVPDNPTPARVINMSLGWSSTCDAATQAAIDFAYSRGTVVVAAAGNDNIDASLASPGSCRQVITVGSVGTSGLRSSFSNFGSSVDISAPGEGIVSALNTGRTDPKLDTYGAMSGTSMAAPFVAAAVALMVSRDATWTPAQVINRVRDARFATRFGAAACTGTAPADPAVTCGAGIVNAATLVAVQPVVSLPVATVDGFTASLLNYDSGLSYDVASDSGSAAFAASAVRQWDFAVTGLAPSQSATATVSITGGLSATVATSVTGSALCAAVVPELGPATPVESGFTFPISNVVAASSWEVSVDQGSASIALPAGIVTVAGLTAGQPATATVTGMSPGCAPGTTALTAAALPNVVLSSVSGLRVSRTRTGLRVSWTVPPTQDGRVVNVKVRISRVNSTRYRPWLNRGVSGYWRTPQLVRGLYRIQVAQVYAGRSGPIRTVRVRY